jgi:monoamine oxidase
VGQPGPAVLIASYTWCDDSLRWDSLPEDLRYEFALRDLAKLYGPEIRQDWTGRAASHSWIEDEFSCGAFALFEPEQQTEIYPDIATPEGRVHFAGEHTTLKHAWIEGAVESAVRVAAEVAAVVEGPRARWGLEEDARRPVTASLV